MARLSAALPDIAVALPQAHHLRDAGAEQRGQSGAAAAVVTPTTTAEVQSAVACCYSLGLPMVARGGGSGLAGGAVPAAGEVVFDLTGLDRVRSFEPELLRIHVEAGVRTADVRRRARENGLLFPPDPGAAEQSTIGGNVATNAGGPHALRYGATGAWVTEVEAVIAGGERIVVGGTNRKWVEGLDLRSLLVGSEGVLGILTAVRLRLAPAPEAAWPVVAAFPSEEAGCDAVLDLIASGFPCSVLDFATEEAAGPTRDSFPGETPPAGFLLLLEVDGAEAEAMRLRLELLDLLAPLTSWTFAPRDRAEIGALWRWRDDMSLRLTAAHGGKVSEDVTVPVERLGEVLTGLREIGRGLGIETASWGHAGDGNLHAAFFADLADPAQVALARRGGSEILELARELGGALSGEHGIGAFKQRAMAASTAQPLTALMRQVRHAFDPEGLFNPGKALP